MKMFIDYKKMLFFNLFLFLIFMSSLPNILSAEPRRGIDCDCKHTGDYVPGLVRCKVPIDTGTSKYQAVVSQYNIEIREIIDQFNYNTLFTISREPSDGWGFSPNGERFVYHYYNQSYHTAHLTLYKTNDGTPIFNTSSNAAQYAVFFSPNGNYLVYAGLSGNNVALTVIDSKTGEQRFHYDITFSVQIGYEGDKLGGVAWGFVKDNGYKDPSTGKTVFFDANFVYVYTTGQTSSRFNLVNLLGTNNPVITEDFTSGGAGWSFSPCGDVAAINYYGTKFYSTNDGTLLGFIGEANDYPLRTVLDYHQYYKAGWWNLFENNADTKCPAAPGGQDSDGDGVPDDQDNCPYISNPDQKDSNNNGIGDACEGTQIQDSDGDGIPDNIDNCPNTPNPGQEDRDGDGIGDACEFDRQPPTWPSGSTLNASNITGTSVNLYWVAATDNVGVTGYRLFTNSKPLVDLPTNICSYSWLSGKYVCDYTLENLTPRTQYTFKVEAFDSEGNITLNGPSVTITTLSNPPQWPDGVELRTENVTHTSLTLVWSPGAEDDFGVKTYRIYKGRNLIAEVSSNILSYDLTIDYCSFNEFSVCAVDDEDQQSCLYLSLILDNYPPIWPFGANLTVTNLTSTSLTLSWPEATEECGNVCYKVYMGDTVIYSTPCTTWEEEIEGGEGGEGGLIPMKPGRTQPSQGTQTSVHLSCLIPGTTYTFKVEAGDKFGNWSSNGPSITVTTESHGTCEHYTERLSTLSNGSKPSISADGRYIVADQVPIIYDRETGQSETIEDQYFSYPSISPDGRYVAYTSVYLNIYDRQTKEKFVIKPHIYNHPTWGRVESGVRPGYDVSIGNTHIAYSGIRYCKSFGCDHDNRSDPMFYLRRHESIYITSIESLTSSGYGFSSISKNSLGLTDNWDCYDPSITPDGSAVAFVCCECYTPVYDPYGGTGVWCRGGHGPNRIYLYRRTDGSSERVDISSTGEELNGSNPSISANGRYVAFEAGGQIYVRDTVSDKTHLVSVSSSGELGNGNSSNPTISADGRFIAFESDADNLVDNDTNGVSEILVHDLTTGQTIRVNLCPCGDGTNEANGESHSPVISADGRFIAYTSSAWNLVPLPEDSNGQPDVFVSEVAFPQPNYIEPGDLDGDGDVDQNDLNILLSYRNQLASACPACDLDGDGMITVLDARKLVLLCTRPKCATQ